MTFWNSVPTHQSARQATVFREDFEGKIQNIKNDDELPLFLLTCINNFSK